MNRTWWRRMDFRATHSFDLGCSNVPTRGLVCQICWQVRLMMEQIMTMAVVVMMMMIIIIIMFIIITVLPFGVGWYYDDDEDEDEDYGEEEEQEEEEEGMTAGTWGVLIDFNPATSHSQRFKQNHRIPKMNWLVSSDKSDWSNRCNYIRLRVQNVERYPWGSRFVKMWAPQTHMTCCFHPTGDKDSKGFSYFSGGWLNHQPAHVGSVYLTPNRVSVLPSSHPCQVVHASAATWSAVQTLNLRLGMVCGFFF